MSCAAGMTELTKRLCLDLTDTLTRDVKLLTNLLKRSRSSVVKTEAELDDMLLTGRERMKLALYDLAKNS